MVNTAQVSFRINKDIKQNAEAALKDMGLSLSSAITVFLTKVGRERRIPFEISSDPFYASSNMRYLDKVISGIEDGSRPLVEHDLIEVEE